MNVIEKRLIELKVDLTDRLRLVKSYADLTEQEKIPFRVSQAEFLAMEDYKKGENLETHLEISIRYEYYCSAAGIKKAIEFINLNKK